MGPRYTPHVDGMHMPTNILMQVCIYMNMMIARQAIPTGIEPQSNPFRLCGKSLMHIQHTFISMLVGICIPSTCGVYRGPIQPPLLD